MVDNDFERKPIKIEGQDESTQLPKVVEEHPVTLVSSPTDVLEEIQKAETKEELEALEELFEISITKKELARVATQDNLLDELLKQASRRILEKPGELSNKDLLDYYNAFSGNIGKSVKKKVDEPDGGINITNTKNEINVNIPDSGGLTRESQNRVMDVVKSILAQADNKNIPNVDEEKGVKDDD